MEHAGLFAGNFQTGGAAEAVGGEVAVQPFFAEHHRDLGGPDVTGLAQDAGDIQFAIGMEIVQGAPGVGPAAVLAVEGIVGRDQAFVEGRGHDADFEHGAGLEVHADGPVQAQVIGNLVVVVQIVGGPRGHGQDRPGAHLLHDGPGGLGVHVRDGGIQGLLHEMLDVIVEGQVDVGAFLRGDFQGAAGDDLPFITVAFALAEPRTAFEQGIPALFDAGAANAFHIGETENVAGECAMGIVAGGQGFEKHAGQVEALHLIGQILMDMAADDFIPAARTVDPVIDLRHGQLEHPGQLGADRLRLPVAEDRYRFNAYILDRQIQGQQTIIPVQDAAAPDQDGFLRGAHPAHPFAQGGIIPQMQIAQADGQNTPAPQQEDGDERHPPHVAAFNHAASCRLARRSGRDRPAAAGADG